MRNLYKIQIMFLISFLFFHHTLFSQSSPCFTITVNSTTICSGSSVTLTASGATTYTWNTSTIGNSIVVSPTTTATYTVSGELSGCPNSTSENATVFVNSVPTITAIANHYYTCFGDTITVTAAGANTYTWDNGSNIYTANPATIITLTDVGYTITVAGTNTNNCVGHSQIVFYVVTDCWGAVKESAIYNTELNIYPNPTADVINIESEISIEDLFISIIDMYGRKIKHTKLEKEIDVKDLNKGIYVLRVINQNKEVLHQQKLVKE